MQTATVTLFHDTRRSSDGVSFVRLSVYADRKQKLFSTGVKVSGEDWKFLERTKGGLPGTVKDETRRKLWQVFYGHYANEAGEQQDGHLVRAQTILNQLGERFTFDAFADALANYGKEKEKPAEQTDLIAALFAKATHMVSLNRFGNALNYELAAKSLRRFVASFSDEEQKEFLGLPIPRNNKQPRPIAALRFEHLTPDFLTTYEQWMLHCGKLAKTPFKPSTGASLTTVGIYLRHVRSVVNDAIEAGILSRGAYPFGRNRYTIPAGANVKKALPKSVIDQIKTYQPIPGTTEQRSHDLWLFSYFCNGANLTDICRMTWNRVDTKAGKMTFTRQKTARSKKQNQTPVVVHLRPEALAIIDRWGNPDKQGNAYVFQFLTPDMTEEQKRRVVRQLVKTTNKWMGKIAEQVGIEGDVNTYSARHSYATTLLKSNAPLAFISKSLGHTNLKTTESYLGSFDDEEAKSFLNAL